MLYPGNGIFTLKRYCENKAMNTIVLNHKGTGKKKKENKIKNEPLNIAIFNQVSKVIRDLSGFTLICYDWLRKFKLLSQPIRLKSETNPFNWLPFAVTLFFLFFTTLSQKALLTVWLHASIMMKPNFWSLSVLLKLGFGNKKRLPVHHDLIEWATLTHASFQLT